MDFPQVFDDLLESGFFFEEKSLHYYASGQVGPLYILQQKSTSLLAKVFTKIDGHERMTAEKEGLELLKKSTTVNIPDIYFADQLPSGSLLIIEFIEGGQYNRNQSMINLGRQLAKLHQSGGQAAFGLNRDNYIGALNQYNNRNKSWANFYFYSRLKPQIDMAIKRGLFPENTIGDEEEWILTIENLYPIESPALIHGDLWAGNMVADKNSQAYLIDPAISYSHREMDIAMSKLFGGFTSDFYSAYNEVYPLAPDFGGRMELSQLYFLLVHVNLFGKSYVSQTRTLIRQYFG